MQDVLALPLGRNCHLGMALTRFNYHEASLFRWADIGLAPLLACLKRNVAESFAGRTMFRFNGTSLGTLDHAAMRARIADVPASARVNTVTFLAEGAAYAHGVQLSLAQAEAMSYAEICAANAAKFAHLESKWRRDLSEPRALAIRLEWEPVVAAEPYLELARALPGAALKVVGPAGGLEGARDGVEFVALRSALPPPSDVMNVSATEAEWRDLFARWGVKPRGAARSYIFDV